MNKHLTINEAADIIQQGGLVAFPTETVYGLGADAFNAAAVANIFKMKERPSFDPLIVHIVDVADLEKLFHHVDDTILKLSEAFWPGPLTIVAPKMHEVPDIVTAGLGTVGVRMPSHPTAAALIKNSGKCIAAPSANRFGRLSPTKAAHVVKQFPDFNNVIDGGNTDVGIESTVVSVSANGFELLRPGVITIEQLERVVPQAKTVNAENTISSPGLLKSHYSPQKPIYIIGESETDGLTCSKAGLISFGKPVNGEAYKYVEILSGTSDLSEAAINLFAAIHRLEDSDADYIVAEPVPETGIGIAIMDRLRKAAYQYTKKK